MTLAADSDANRARLVAQLYDDWHGYYLLQVLFMGVYTDVRPLSRDEALTYHCKAGEALSVVWTQTKGKQCRSLSQ